MDPEAGVAFGLFRDLVHFQSDPGWEEASAELAEKFLKIMRFPIEALIKAHAKKEQELGIE